MQEEINPEVTVHMDQSAQVLWAISSTVFVWPSQELQLPQANAGPKPPVRAQMQWSRSEFQQVFDGEGRAR